MSVVGPNLLDGGSKLSTHLSGLAVGGLLLGAGDPRSTRIVYAMVIGLALIGLLFAFLAVWVIRQTRVDLEMLSPLERMGDSEWRKSDPASQRRSLDELRPSGAEPLQTEPHRPLVDSEFDQSDRPVQSFDDLSPVSSEGDDPTPVGLESDELDTPVASPESEPREAEVEVEAEVETDKNDADEPGDEVDEPDSKTDESEDEPAQRVEQ